ncbi:trypsin-like serine protease [Allokutzneria sp. A3M-2-11 16]|uniref:S1 family peptidase n=1 Tax=Allokutzneria sp. A3M-2-11 16 TaxID=2962043 RepID=UPI0020B710B7|nr:trypsin-like serine protease [Allokutzneria sp. A3M-2-11 16]MCP3800354.1 trypsin-like serine protease [Allokutzneria sp. A3M-2-11 16]
MRRAAVAVLTAGLVAPAGASAQPVQPTPSRDAEARIIGGTPADRDIIGASLQFAYKGDPNFHYCGAVPITKKHLLGAAHCFLLPGHPKPEQIHIRAGDHDKNKGEYARVAKVWTGDFGEKPPGVNDVAVITLDRAINVTPMWLAPTAGRIGGTLRETGWGRTDAAGVGPDAAVLQQVDMRLAEPSACAAGPIDANELCLAPPRGGQSKGNCFGDSGSPTLRRVAGRWMVAGVASRGTRPDNLRRCDGGFPNIYTDVTGKHRWSIIRAVLGLEDSAPVSAADEARAAAG